MIKIQRNTLMLALLLIPFFKPMGLAYWPFPNRVYQIWKMASLLVIVLYLLAKRYLVFDKKVFTGFLGFVLFSLVYLVSTYRTHAPTGDLLNNIITNCVIFVLMIQVGRTPLKENMFRALYYTFKCLIILHIVSVFIVRAGMITFVSLGKDYMYFMGTDNHSAFATIPMIGMVLYLGMMRSGCTQPTKEDLCLLVALVFVYGYTRSTSAFIGGICLLGGVLLYMRRRYTLVSCFRPQYILVYVVLFLILVLVFDFHNVVLGNLSALFGKSDYANRTLNSRTIIWPMALGMIREKMLLGHGNLTTEMLESYCLYGTDHAHNILLEVLLRGGIVGAVSILCFFLKPFVGKKLSADTDFAILTITLSAFFILSIMDYYPMMQYQYCLMALVYLAVYDAPAKNVEYVYEKQE